MYNSCPRDSRAAKACLEFSKDGFDDWFLPSINELLKIRDNAGILGLLSNENYDYASSSEANADEMITSPYSIAGQVASSIYIRNISKMAVIKVMPVRYF